MSLERGYKPNPYKFISKDYKFLEELIFKNGHWIIIKSVVNQRIKRQSKREHRRRSRLISKQLIK